MARSIRTLRPEYPHHIIHRGHNRQPIFFAESHYVRYLEIMIRLKTRLRIQLTSYCLMSNHVHLILTPARDPSNLSKLMKRLAGEYTQFINRQAKRSGTLWEGRFRSSPIETDEYLLACSRYVELNPVRANMVARPEDYRHSSYRAKVSLAMHGWLDLDPCYRAMGSDPNQRADCYKRFVRSDIPQGQQQHIRDAVNGGFGLGSDP